MLALSLLAAALQICLSCNVEGREPKTSQRGSPKPEQQLQCKSEMTTLSFFYVSYPSLQEGHVLGSDHCHGDSGDATKACLNAGCSLGRLVSCRCCAGVPHCRATGCTGVPTAVPGDTQPFTSMGLFKCLREGLHKHSPEQLFVLCIIQAHTTDFSILGVWFRTLVCSWSLERGEKSEQHFCLVLFLLHCHSLCFAKFSRWKPELCPSRNPHFPVVTHLLPKSLDQITNTQFFTEASVDATVVTSNTICLVIVFRQTLLYLQ